MRRFVRKSPFLFVLVYFALIYGNPSMSLASLTTPSQIAERQLEFFENRHVLLAGEVEDSFALNLCQTSASVSLFSTNYSHYQAISKHSQVDSFFGANYADFKPKNQPDMVLFYWPKAKAEAEFLLAMLFAHLPLGTEICVVGENRSGVKSIEKMFKPYGTIKKYDSARRCSFYWGEYQEQAPSFNFESWFKTYHLDLGEDSITVKSLPGVFSHGELDLGSQLLIEHLPKLSGKCLDFGCGAGVIGSVMAKRLAAQGQTKAQVEMCDISALAIASSKATLAANQLEAKVFASNVYSDCDNNYQFIISNPPFHSGLDTSYNATETLLEDAPAHLARNGQLCIVANSFLKYQPIIQTSFGLCNTLAKTNKFVIYQAQKV